MNELKHIVADIESVFAESSFPADFLEAWDQMECLASHTGRETFLVQKKDGGNLAVATCCDLTLFPLQPDFRMLRELQHPGLPHYYEQYRNETMLCIVREYIDGETLSAYAGERDLSVTEIVSISEQLCDILQYLHERKPPVVHRDIKPENIIVRPDGQIVLIDFDIARAYREGAGTDTVFFGTRGYAPPEQYGFGQTDPRADIYAFGVLLRWMMTGSVRENKNIRMDGEMQKIIDRCTAFSPDDRYAHILQVKDALSGVGKHPRRISLKAAAACVLAGMLFLCAGFAAGRYTDWFRPAAKIAFQEPLIEQAVRLETGRESGALTEEDLSQVKRIYIYGTEALADPDEYFSRSIDNARRGPVRTLDDLELLPNLEEVRITYQGYVDVTAMAGLPQLQTVELKHMRISGIAPIADVPRLREASLFDTKLTDVTPLENCSWLESLDIGLNAIESTAQIGSYPNVRSLGLMWMELENLDGMAERFPKVQAVALEHAEIQDLSGLKDLPELETVYALPEQADELETLFEGTDVQLIIDER